MSCGTDEQYVFNDLTYKGFLFHKTHCFLIKNKVMMLRLSQHPSPCLVFNSDTSCLKLNETVFIPSKKVREDGEVGYRLA